MQWLRTWLLGIALSVVGAAPGAQEPAKNNSGQVLVLEYHQFGNHEERWMRNSKNFREDLARLYAENYRAVNLLDYLHDKNNDTMRLKPGEKPIILTFDDASEQQFQLRASPKSASIEDVMAAADPESAARVMYDFHKEHPDWRLAGTFYASFPPFKSKDWTLLLRTLSRAGFEIGNHTLNHGSLAMMSKEQVEKEIVGAIKQVRKAIPGYTSNTLALPFGISPKDEDAKRALTEGAYDGISYHHEAILLVGSGAVPPKTSSNFNPLRLPRLQVIEPAYDKALSFDAVLNRFGNSMAYYSVPVRQ